MAGLWPGTLINIGGTVLFFALVGLLRSQVTQLSGRGLLGALMGGFSVAFYGWALAETQISKAVLLFYLTPIWSLILERICYGRRLSFLSLGLIAVAFVGILFLFEWQFDFAAWTLGDTCALLAGMTWSASLLFIFSSQNPQPPLPLSALILFAASLTGLILLALPGVAEGGALVLSASTLMLGLVFGGLYLGPTLWMTMWVANRLAPSVLCLLLTAEIVAALVTSAWIKGEPFGVSQFIGSVLVVGSGTFLGLVSAAASESIKASSQRA